MPSRLNRLRTLLIQHNIDSIIISNPSNIFYISGFRGHDSFCLVSDDEAFIITDFRYRQQAEKESAGFKIISEGGSLFEKASDIIKKRRLKKTGFESHHLTHKEVEVISRLSSRSLKPVFNIIEQMRMIKDLHEIDLVKKASAVTKKAMAEAKKAIRPNLSEDELALIIDIALRRNGAESSAFETIVASGPNSAMPHARPTQRRLGIGKPVMLDFGARVKGYTSDLTRTYFMGKIERSFNIIYSIVASAQAKALETIRPGVKIAEIDKTARQYIDKKGFGRYFGHSTGHGIGIDVHEMPSINSKNQSVLEKGMVFSVEPAIYIPQKGGVRIEDTVMVTPEGSRVLTRWTQGISETEYLL